MIKTVFGSHIRPIFDEWRTLHPYQLINYLIQGTAANIGILAFINLNKLLPRDSRVVGFIHDEFLVEHPKERKEEVRKALNLSMQEAFIECFPKATDQRDRLVHLKTNNHWKKA